MTHFLFASCSGCHGRKLVVFRTFTDLYAAKDTWPSAEVEFVPDCTTYTPAVVSRALSNLLRGEDGWLYCKKYFGGK